MNRAQEIKAKEHEIKAKIILGLPLSKEQRCYYLLFMATLEEAKEFLRKEKEMNR